MLRKAIFILTKVGLSFGLGILIFDHTILAQVIPDNTLPANSLVTSDGNTAVITGGTTAGNNLFHSFEQFSIPSGNSSYFNNTSNIQNIFSRVTGSSVSIIDGAIKANGTANLFLLNPNGIIFGPNASLNIGGSFLGSTADYFQFSDGSKFSAVEPQTTPLLTISRPLGLGFGLNPGQIYVQGNGHELRVADPTIAVGSPLVGSGESSMGLRTDQGETLALIGGQVTLDGGILTAPSGQIQIGSVAGGIVGLSLTPADLSFNYDNVSSFRDIQLSNGALIDASGTLNSQISTQSRNLYLKDRSLILISNFGDQTFGKINIDATDSVVLTGIANTVNLNPYSSGVAITKGILSQNLSMLKGVDITISAKDLVIQSNSTIATTSFKEGRGGDITVKVLDSIKIMGKPPIDFLFLPSGIGSLNLNLGQGGNIGLSGKYLFIQDGGLLTTQTWGPARGGDILANFSEGIEISGGFPISPASNSFIPSTFGTISISDGDTGNVLVNTREVRIKNGGRINATTAASGRAGDIKINATNSVEVAGRIPSSTGNALYNLSQIVSSATQNNSFLLQFLSLPNLPQGKSGDVRIDTNKLIIQDEGQVSVINEGTGDAGIIKIGSPLVFLDTNGSLTAETRNGVGGNIKINSDDLFVMRRNSRISTSAGNAQAGGDGGQININTKFIIAPPLENSDITANAFKGEGGNVNITASTIFGLVPRSREELQTLLRTDNPNELDPSRLPSNDVTAISQTNPSLSGQVTLNRLDTEPRQVLTNLPQQLVDLSRLIAQGCSGSGDNVGKITSEFIITGRGGLPPQPGDPLRAEARVINNATIESVKEQGLVLENTMLVTGSNPSQLVEAQNLVLNAQGEMVLTAQLPNATPDNSSSTQVTCYAP